MSASGAGLAPSSVLAISLAPLPSCKCRSILSIRRWSSVLGSSCTRAWPAPSECLPPHWPIFLTGSSAPRKLYAASSPSCCRRRARGRPARRAAAASRAMERRASRRPAGRVARRRQLRISLNRRTTHDHDLFPPPGRGLDGPLLRRRRGDAAGSPRPRSSRRRGSARRSESAAWSSATGTQRGVLVGSSSRSRSHACRMARASCTVPGSPFGIFREQSGVVEPVLAQPGHQVSAGGRCDPMELTEGFLFTRSAQEG